MKLISSFKNKFSRSHREDTRLRQMGRYQATETTLLGREISIIDAPTYLAGRQDIIERKAYDFEAGVARPRIIDCGANIGLSVIFFKQRYPESRITAFEADPVIAGVLKRNLIAFGYSDVCVHQAAVWVNNNEVEFCMEGGLSGRLPKGEGDAAQRTKVPACRLRDVIAEEPVDMLKLDVEGAETAIMKDCHEFIRKDWIRHLFLEYHSHDSESQTLHELLAMLNAGGYRYHILPAYVRKRPFVDRRILAGMDLQLNVYAY